MLARLVSAPCIPLAIYAHRNVSAYACSETQIGALIHLIFVFGIYHTAAETLTTVDRTNRQMCR